MSRGAPESGAASRRRRQIALARRRLAARRGSLTALSGNKDFIPRWLCFCRAAESCNLEGKSGPDVYAARMPNVAYRREIEIKLRVPDVATLHKRLRQLGARKISPRAHELNTLYDTPGKELTRRGRLIRIRIERPASLRATNGAAEDGPAILTYKGPAPSSSSGIGKKSGGLSRSATKRRSFFPEPFKRPESCVPWGSVACSVMKNSEPPTFSRRFPG